MEDIIQRLVEVDRSCARRIEDAKIKKIEAQTNMTDKKKQIYESFINEQNKEIEEHKVKLLKKNQEEAKRRVQEYQKSMKTIEALYQKNKDIWVAQIYERCIK